MLDHIHDTTNGKINCLALFMIDHGNIEASSYIQEERIESKLSICLKTNQMPN